MKGSLITTVATLSLLLTIVLLTLTISCESLQARRSSSSSSRVSYMSHVLNYKERVIPKINIQDEGAKELFVRLNDAFPEKKEGVFPDGTPTFDCDVCVFFMSQMQILVSQNETIDEAEDLFADLCVLLGIEKRVVCSGLSHEFGPEIQQIALSDVNLQPIDICEHFLICPTTLRQNKPIVSDESSSINSKTDSTKPVTATTPSAPSNTRFFIHVSDIHHDPLYEEGTKVNCGLPICCRASDGPGTASKFGEYTCDANAALLKSLETFINTNSTFNSRFGDKIDFMIWTGDNPPHDIWAESRESQLNASKTVADWLYNSFTVQRKWPIYPAIGNHESFPVDQFPGPPRNNWLMDPTAQYWSKWLGPSQLSTVRQGAHYIIQIPNTDHYILSINTMYCDLNNFWMILNDTDPAGQIAWMRSQLETIQKNKGSVYIIGHIPLRDSGCTYNYSSRIGDVIREYSTNGVIKGNFFGHTHDDGFFVFKQGAWNNSQPVSVGYITPSVTPFTYLNPSFRVFEYDPETFEIVDYHQFNTDLNKTIQTGVVDWRLFYSAKSAYDLKDLSAQSWSNLISVFAQNDPLFQQWNFRHYSGYYGTGPCITGCKNDTLCGMMTSTFKETFECTGKEYSLSNLWPYIINHLV